MNRIRWQLDPRGCIRAWGPGAAAFFRLPAEQVLGKPCAEVVRGTDGFGRPLCGRCPVLREIKYGAYQASTALSCGGKRLRCQGFAHGDIHIELKPESQRDSSEVLASLSWAVRKLTDEPERFFQTLQVFLAGLRKNLGMEAAELFLADPQERYLVLTAYDGVHREAFMEKPWFAWGEGYPGLVALGHRALVTHDLATDARYLRQKVKKLGYKTYVCYPLELPQGLIGVLNLASRDPQIDDEALLEQLSLMGPMLAASLYMVLTRLGERGLLSIAAALRQGHESQGLEAFLAQATTLSRASCVRLVLQDGRNLSQGRCEAPECPHVQQCPVWQGKVRGVKVGLEPCPHTAEGRLRYCLPLWSGGSVVGVQQFHFARTPQPPSQAVAPILWLERLGAEALWPHSEQAEKESPLLEIHTLGGLQVRRRGELLSAKAFGRRQAYTLLKLLLAHRGQTLSKEELCECLWPGEDPRETQRRLHVLMHGLRQALETDPTQPQIVLREGEGYRFAPQVRYFLDLERFEALLHEGEGLEGTAALERYREALALYKGDFLSDEPYADWAELERSYLRERAVGTLFRVAQIAEALHLVHEAQSAYRRILTLDPWREEAYHALIGTMVLSGQEFEARSLFAQYRARMEREGLPVSPELAHLVHMSA
ncbi:MAG: winged helix-turn-helix domain-containing protein [Thermaceae bacterium]|nr:winged helix-turn-helix domain-containing protein [Thermaceae bacterium]